MQLHAPSPSCPAGRRPPETTFVGAGPCGEAVLAFNRIDIGDRVTVLQADSARGDLLWETTINLNPFGSTG